MRFLKCFFMLALTTASAISFAGSVNDVLKLVPSNSELVVVTRDLKAIETKLNGILTKFSLPADKIGDLSQLSEVMSGKLGLESLSLSGDHPVCFIFTNIMAANNSWALFLPVDDLQAVLDNAQDSEVLDNGLRKCGDDNYVFAKDGYLVIGDNEFNMVNIKDAQSSFTAEDVVMKDMQDSDLTIYANMTNLMNVGRMMIPAVLMNVPQFQSNADLMQSVQRLVQNMTYLQKLSISVDYNDGDLVTKSNVFAAPGSDISKLFKPAEKVALSEFSNFPDGNAMSFTAISLPKSWYEQFVEMLGDLSSMSSMQGASEEYSKAAQVLFDILADFIEQRGDDFADYLTVDYMLDIDNGRVQGRMASLGYCGLGYDEFLPLWAKIKDADVSAMLKINKYEPEAGNIDGVDYSHFDYDFLQMAGNGQTFTTNYDIYVASRDKKIVAGWSKEAFDQAVHFLNAESKLTNSNALEVAKKYLPETANFYCIADTGTVGSLIYDNFQQQTKELTEKSPEMTEPLAMVSSVFESMSSFDGTVATSFEVNEGYVRFSCVYDNKLIDSIGNMVKSGISVFDSQQDDQVEQENSKEF